MNPVVWNVILSAVVIILICTCYEIRLITQWRWYIVRQRRSRSARYPNRTAADDGLGREGEVPGLCNLPRLTPELIAMLPTFVWTDKKLREAKEREQCDGELHEDECVICQEDVVCGEQVTSLPCHHVYHKDCIYAWLVRRATCPKCRRDLSLDLMPEPNLPPQSEVVTSSSVVADLESSYLHRHSHLTDITVVSSLHHTEGGARTEMVEQHGAPSLDLSVGSREDGGAAQRGDTVERSTTGAAVRAAGTGGLFCRVLMMMNRDGAGVHSGSMPAQPSPSARGSSAGRRRNRNMCANALTTTTSAADAQPSTSALSITSEQTEESYAGQVSSNGCLPPCTTAPSSEYGVPTEPPHTPEAHGSPSCADSNTPTHHDAAHPRSSFSDTRLPCVEIPIYCNSIPEVVPDEQEFTDCDEDLVAGDMENGLADKRAAESEYELPQSCEQGQGQGVVLSCKQPSVNYSGYGGSSPGSCGGLSPEGV